MRKFCFLQESPDEKVKNIFIRACLQSKNGFLVHVRRYDRRNAVASLGLHFKQASPGSTLLEMIAGARFP